MGEGANALFHAVLIDVHNQVKAIFCGYPVAKLDHFAEFPGGVDMHQRKGRRGRVKRLARQMQQNR